MIVSSLTQAPYVDSQRKAIEDALELSKPKAGETVFDLGCGDARTLIFAAKKYDVKGIGYEISPFCIIKSRLKIYLAGFSGQIKIHRQSLFTADFCQADIVYLYLTNSILDKLEPIIFKKCKTGCRIVNLAFPFKNHPPTAEIPAKQLGRQTKIYLYRV
jgi:SAM-dependent methyltransferase